VTLRRGAVAVYVFAAVVLTALALGRTLLDLHAVVVAPLPTVDPLGANEARFAALRDVLPRGMVGYVTDETDPDLRVQRYFLAQYALAPVLLVRTAGPRWVIGDFAAGRAPQDAPQPRLHVARDFGNGVVLFKADE
jgi:hypothetical protein